VSCALKEWALQADRNVGISTVLGKGGKTRSILSCAALLLRASLLRVMEYPA
jgi:hypothetical protein